MVILSMEHTLHVTIYSLVPRYRVVIPDKGPQLVNCKS